MSETDSGEGVRVITDVPPGVAPDALLLHVGADGKVLRELRHRDGRFEEPVRLAPGEALGVPEMGSAAARLPGMPGSGPEAEAILERALGRALVGAMTTLWHVAWRAVCAIAACLTAYVAQAFYLEDLTGPWSKLVLCTVVGFGPVISTVAGLWLLTHWITYDEQRLRRRHEAASAPDDKDDERKDG